MSSWLANLTQAVQGRLESLVDDGSKLEISAEEQEQEEPPAAVASESAAAEEDDSNSATPLASSSSTDVPAGAAAAADLLEQLEQQRALIDGLKALIREKDSRNQEQEQIIKTYAAGAASQDVRAPDKLGSRIAELERTVEELRLAVHAKEDLIRQMQDLTAPSRQPAPEQHDVSDVEELMRSISKKDAAILRLQDRIQELEQKMMDLHELVNEKDQVIHGRDQAIKLMQEQMSTKDVALQQATADHVALKSEFVGLQERFAAEEGAWRERLVQYNAAYTHVTEQYEIMQRQLLSVQADHAAASSNKDKMISDLQAALERKHADGTQATAAPPATASAATELVQPITSAALSSPSAADGSHSAGEVAKDKELADLKKSLSEQSAKMLKIKAQALAKVKALQKELEEAKQAATATPVQSVEVSELRNRIAEIEEEKGNLQLQLVDMDEVKSACAKLTQELALVNASLQQAKTENASLAHTLDSVRQTMAQVEDDTKEALADGAAEISSLRDRLAELQKLRDASVADLDAEHGRADQLTADLHQLRAEMAELQQRHALTNGELTLLRSHLAQADAALSAATEAKVTAELRMAELEEIRDGLLKDKADQSAAADGVQQQLLLLQSEAAVAAKDAAHERELEAANRERAAQLEQLRRQADELELLRLQLADVDRQRLDGESQEAAAAATTPAASVPAGCDDRALLAEQQLAAALDEAARLRLAAEQREEELQLLLDEKRRLADLLEALRKQQLHWQQDSLVVAAAASAAAEVAAAQRADELLSALRSEHEARVESLRSEHAALVGSLQAAHAEQCAELSRQHEHFAAAASAGAEQRLEQALAERVAAAVALEQQHDEALALAALERQRHELDAEQRRRLLEDAEQRHADALAALREEQRTSAIATIEQLDADRRRSQAEALAALQRDHDESVAALRLEHADSLAALRGELDAAVAAGQKEAAAESARAAARGAELERSAALEQQLAAYAESQTLLAEQLRVLIDERARADEAASSARRELEQLSSLARTQLAKLVADCHATSANTAAGLDTSVTEGPAAVEDALRLAQAAAAALQDRLQACESQLSSLQQERAALVASKVDAEGASRLPSDLVLHASSLLPAERQPATGATAVDWCSRLTSELDELRASQQHSAAELKASAARHTEKLASLASNLLEVESQLSASAAEAETLRSEMAACQQKLAAAEAALATQQAATAQQVAAAAAAEHEATLRKYAAVIKKLKADLATKDRDVAATHEQSARVATRLRELLLLDGGVRPQPPQHSIVGAVAAAAAGHDDSGLDVSLQLDASALSSSTELTVEQCIECLQEQLSSVRTEVAARRAAAAQNADELQLACAKKEAALEELRQLRDQLQAADRQSTSAEAQLRERCADLSGRLDAALAEVGGQRAECDRLGRLLSEAQLAVGSLTADVEHQRTASAALRLESESAARLAAAAAAELELASRQLADARAANEELEARVRASAAQVEALASSADAAGQRAEAAERRCHELQAAAEATAGAQLTASQAKADKMLAKLRQLKERNDELQSRLDAAESKAAAAQQRLADEASRSDAALDEARMLAAADARRPAEERCAQLATELETAAAARASSEAAAAAAAAAEQQKLRDELDSIAGSLRDANSELKLLRAELDRARSAQCDAAAEAAEQRTEAEALRSAQRTVAAEAEALRAEVEALRGQRSRLSDQLNDSDSQLAALRSAAASLTAARDEAVHMLDAARREVAASAEEHRQLRAALDEACSRALGERLALERRAVEAEEAAARARLDGDGERAAFADQQQSLERRLAETQRQYGMLEADNSEFERLATSLREAKGRLEVEARDLRKRLAAATAAEEEKVGWRSAHEAAAEPPALRRETVRPLGQAVPPQLSSKDHAGQQQTSGEGAVATAAVRRHDDDVHGDRAAVAALASIRQELSALCTFVSTEAFPELSALIGEADGDAEPCVGFLHRCLVHLRDRAAEWLAQSVKIQDLAALQHKQQQAMEAALQERERECQQLGLQVQQLSSSQQELSYQYGQAVAALQRAGTELQLLRQQQQDAPPAPVAAESQALLVRIAQLETMCRCLEKDLDDARQREVASSFNEPRSSRLSRDQAQKAAGEHSIYMDDLEAGAAAASFDRSSPLPDSAATAASAADEQLPLLQRAGRLMEHGVPVLRSFVRRQASQMRRLLRSQPRPQLLLLIYAFLLHVLVLGASFGNWFCP